MLAEAIGSSTYRKVPVTTINMGLQPQHQILHLFSIPERIEGDLELVS